jgi:hypothetical protein
MSNLLNSGHIGLGEKTDEQVIKVWVDAGIIADLDDEIKLKVARMCEKVASILLSMDNYYSYDTRIDVAIFPIIARIVRDIHKTVDGDKAKGIIYLLEGEYILKRVSAMYDDAMKFYKKHLSESNMDVEAACVSWICDIIMFEYIESFRGKEIIDLGDGKYDVVLKLD